MGKYNPKTVLRQTSNSLLRQFFESREIYLDLAWDEIRETRIEPVFDALQQLPDRDRQSIEIVLQDIYRIASSDAGVQQLIRENTTDGFTEKLESFDSRYDKAIWTCMRCPAVWDAAVRFFASDNLSQRYWFRRQGSIGVEPDTSAQSLEKFQGILSTFFVEQQGRGHHCLVEHLRRSDDHDYFFVYLSNYAETYQTWDGENELVRRSQRHTFEVVFAYDRSTGSLDTYAQGGKAVRDELQQLFASAILEGSLPPQCGDAMAYNLQLLKLHDFRFPTDPEDHILNVKLKTIQIRVLSTTEELITLSCDKPGSTVQDLLWANLNLQKLPFKKLHVTRACITIQIASGRRNRSLTFELTGNSCNLKSKPEEMQQLGEKYLLQWGIVQQTKKKEASHAA